MLRSFLYTIPRRTLAEQMSYEQKERTLDNILRPILAD